MIIYFSGTGNSFSIARRLGEKMGERVVPLKDAVNDGSDNIIFVFPTYCFDIPKNVREFIKNFDISKNQTVMGISVSGGSNGNSEHTFIRLIEKKGLKVSKFKNIAMTDNSFPVLFNGEVNYKEVDEEKMVDEFLNMKYENKASYNPFNKATEALLFSPLPKRYLRKKVDAEKCVGCGVCADICPNNNIKMENGKAVIGNNCAECYSCLHWCPHQAVYMRKPISKDRQYHNKHVNAKQLNQ